jgi:glutamyl-tRNA synthetase
MGKLSVAVRAIQAVTVPSVILTTVVNESHLGERITVQLEDVEDLETGKEAVVELTIGDHSPVRGGKAVIQELLTSYPSLRGKQPELEDEWVKKVSNFESLDFKVLEPHLLELDSHLTLRSHIVGYFLSVADLVIWGVLRGNRVAVAAIKKGTYVNVTRWFKYVEETCPLTVRVMEELNAQAKEKKASKSKEGASYDIALKDTEKGVVTRFPPEPS